MSAVKLPAGWTRVKLGDVAVNSTAVSSNPVEDGYERYVLGKDIPDGGTIETWGEVGDGHFGSRIRTRIEADDVICTTRGPNLRVARATFRALGAHTNFVLRTANTNVMLQDFLALIAESAGFQTHLARNFRGSVNLFVNWSDAAKYEFALPPLDEQHRIVELIGAIDRSVGSAESQDLRFRTLVLALVHETLFQSPVGTTSHRPLAELLVTACAGSWGVDAGTGDRDCMVIRSTEFTNIGALASVPPAIRGISTKELAKLELRAGDILVERSGGTEDRPVGRVISWPGGPTAVPSNFVHLLRVDESAVPSSVLKWTLWYLHQVGATREFQTASTNMRNLRIKAYLQQPIPVLPLAEAVTLGETIEAADKARRIEKERIAALRALRAQVLSVVLGGGDVH